MRVREGFYVFMGDRARVVGRCEGEGWRIRRYFLSRMIFSKRTENWQDAFYDFRLIFLKCAED